MNIFQVDAFTNELFKGNPAAICPLNQWIPDNLMQAIAEENNLSETAFFVNNGAQYEIRWFTPHSEVDLCGHATLAAAHIIFSELNFPRKTIEFNSKSGVLTVSKEKDWYILNFPSEEIIAVDTPEFLEEAFQSKILKTYQGNWKCLVELESENEVKNLSPDFGLLKKVGFDGIIVTAKGVNTDFVSRFFAPKIGIDEDPVTGAAHTILIPYWANKLNKNNLNTIQLSKRTGFLKCLFLDDRVEMSGQAITYFKGQLTI